MTTRKKLSPIKENSGESKTFKKKYKVKISKSNPKNILKKRRVFTASSYDRRTKLPPKRDGHGNKTRLPLAKKSRKKKRKKYRKTQKGKKKKRNKRNKSKKQKNRNVFAKGSDFNYQLWGDLKKDIENNRRNYITRQWIDLADPTLPPNQPECIEYGKKNRIYKVNVSMDKEINGNILFDKPEIISRPDNRLNNKCYWSNKIPSQSLSRQDFEFATKTGAYKEAKHNQWIVIKKAATYDMMEH